MTDSHLLKRLTGLRQTVQRRLLAYGVCTLVATAIAAALGLVVLDWLFWLPGSLRLGLSTGFIAAVGCSVFFWVVRPVTRPPNLRQLAGRLERYIWQLEDGSLGRFEDRLSTAVDFLSGTEAGSAQLRHRVITNTDQLIKQVQFDRALSIRPLFASGALLAVTIVTILILLTASPGFLAVGWQRYAAPFGPTEWPRQVEIVPSTSRMTVAEGESAMLRIRIARGQRPTLRPKAYLRDSDGQVTTLVMQREATNQYACLITAIRRDLVCWFEAGDDDTRDELLHIQVGRRPGFAELTASIAPPAYVQATEPRIADLKSGDPMAVLGSRVTVTAVPTKPPAVRDDGTPAAWLEFADGTETPLLESNSGRLGASFALDATTEFRIYLRDRTGLESLSERPYRIMAVADQPPMVTVLEPRGLTEVTPTASVRLSVQAEDDFALESLALTAGVARGASQRLPLTDGMAINDQGDRVTGTAEHVWNIASLGAEPGETITYSVEATDNYARQGASPQVGRSDELRLRVISPADFERRLRDAIALLADRVRRALSEQQSLREDTGSVVIDLGDESLPDAEATGVASGLSVRQSRLADRVHDLARRFRRLGRQSELNAAVDAVAAALRQEQIQGVAGALVDASAGPMAAAARRLGDTGAGGADQRQALGEAVTEQQAAIDALTRVLRTMDQWGDFESVVAKTRNLLDRQQRLRAATEVQGKATLGERPEDLSDDHRTEMRRIARTQEQLAGETEQALAKLGEYAESLRTKDPTAADAVAAAQRAAWGSDLVRQMREASRAVGENRNAAAVVSQRTAETGLSRMLAALEERRERELAELVKRIEDQRQALAEIIRQEEALIGVNRESQELTADPAAFAVQSEQQRTVRRNTEHLAGEMERAERMNEPAGLVRTAAEPMGRAESLLTNSEGPGAESLQRQAVEILNEALAALERIADRAQFEAMQQSLAVVQAKLQEVRSRQQGINEQSSLLVERAALGKRLARADNRRASKLARDQQGVRPAIEEEVIPRLGQAPVYEWVLERVMDGVDGSARALSRRELDDALAARQATILNDIDVLITAIDDAVRLPPPDEYAAGASAGGGGAGGTSPQQPSIPGAAQLLVLKTMQMDLNARTVRIAENFDPNSATEQELRELKSLAERQDGIRSLTERLTNEARAPQPGPGQSLNAPPPYRIVAAQAPAPAAEDDDLSKRLIRRATGQDDADIMDGIMRLMGDVRLQLDRDFDPGTQTQTLQQEIVKKLDEAIAAAQQQRSRSASKSQSRGDKRRSDQQPQPKPASKRSEDKQGQQPQPGTGEAGVTKGEAKKAAVGPRLREFRRGWGHLPSRDREEVLQGIDEDVLEPYRELVERYFRTLAEEPEE